MSIQEMHYDFKSKFNKIDSQGNRNLIIPEIDHVLNLALELFVENTAFPRKSDVSINGFEKTTRITEEIRPLVTKADFTKNGDYFLIPTDYWYYVKSVADCTKETCVNKSCNTVVRQHDDDFNTAFSKSSFEWREVNITFDLNGIKTYSEGFTVNSLNVTYIKKHSFIHNAAGYNNNTYTRLNGTVLTGTENCILPENTHKYIVDIAVQLSSISLNSGNPQVDNLRSNLNILNS